MVSLRRLSCAPSLRLLTAAMLAWAQAALATEPVRFGPYDVKTVFAIGKSDDHNQVQYALKLDAECRPAGAEPVFGYWREYDNHERLLPMSWLDQMGYGIGRQQVKGQRVSMSIKTAANRDIDIVATKNADGTCHADPYTNIGGRRARLRLIFLQLSGPFSVDWVELRGTDPETGEALTERVPH